MIAVVCRCKAVPTLDALILKYQDTPVGSNIAICHKVVADRPHPGSPDPVDHLKKLRCGVPYPSSPTSTEMSTSERRFGANLPLGIPKRNNSPAVSFTIAASDILGKCDVVDSTLYIAMQTSN